MPKPQIALLTHSGSPQLTRDDRHLAEAIERSAGVTAMPWDAADALDQIAGSDAVVIRSTWNYTEVLPAFLDFVDAVGRTGTPMFNGAPVVHWNCDKHYLGELECEGVAVLPTIFAPQADHVLLSELVAGRSWSDLVIKPTVSATARGLFRIRASEIADRQEQFAAALAEQDLMIQPLAPEVASDGEWSLMFFGGRYSHAVRKRAARGDIRVQSDFGGRSQAEAAPAALIADAERLLEHVHQRFPDAAPLLYARVDGIERDGRLMLMELELIEPELFFRRDGEAASRCAAALLEQL